jgi:gamma-glutamyltranspeptidase/glutathione hydrolase
MLRNLILATFIIIIYSNCDIPGEKDPAIHNIGVVSSAHPLASKAGIEILKEGGNAFDAAVTIAATLNVVEPMMSGMGGYGTILIYDAEKKKVRFLDSSGKIPLNTNADMMRSPTPDFLQNRRGSKAVSTPGNVNAWFAMSDTYGNLEWAALFDDPIKIAESGFPVSSRLSNFIKGSFHTYSAYTQSFYGKNGIPIQAGDKLIQKDLGASLRMIAKKGIDAFYKGSIASAIEKEMNETDGFLSYQDLIDDKAEWWEPICIEYRGYKVFTASPPSTAFPSLIRLGLMENFQNDQHNSVEHLHAFAEATKFAYTSRLMYAGDPEIKPPPLDKLLSKSYLQEIATKFDPAVASEFIMSGNNGEESKNTTHFVVADKWGNIVSATQTLGNLFGSRIMPKGTGIWLNNSLAYCTYEPKGNPMDAIPGQRKLSGDCPTIIFKGGKPWVALGTPGGHTIGQTVPQMVMNLIDFNMELQEAIDAPRISFIEPSSLAIESDIPENIYQDLSKRGHNVMRVKGLGNAHALKLLYDDNGYLVGFEGASDRRGEGLSEIIN